MGKKSWRMDNTSDDLVAGGCGLIILCCAILFGIYTGVKLIRQEIKLASDRKLVKSCFGKEFCDGRIKALERLVEAKKSLKKYDLSNADLNYASLSNADFRKANLTNATFYETDLFRADFTNANLTNTDLREASLHSADFKKARLINTDLEEADLSNADLKDATLTNTNFVRANLNRAYLGDVNLSQSVLKDATVKQTKFFGAKNLTTEQIKATCNWQEAVYDTVLSIQLKLRQ